MQELLNFGGWLLISIATSTSVGALFVWLGKSWVTNLFSIELINLKHSNSIELDRLKSYWGTLVNRTTKLHQQEFEVIPDIWTLALSAEGHIRNAVSPLQQYADIDRMPEERMQAFIEESGMKAWQKSELMQETDKNKYYQRYRDWEKLSSARDAYRDFHMSFKSKGIFLTAEMKAKFEELDDLYWGAIAEHTVNLEMRVSEYEGATKGRKKIDEFMANTKSKADEVESLIRDRLWNKGIDGGEA